MTGPHGLKAPPFTLTEPAALAADSHAVACAAPGIHRPVADGHAAADTFTNYSAGLNSSEPPARCHRPAGPSGLQTRSVENGSSLGMTG